MTRGVTLHEFVDHVETHGADAEHSEELKRDNRRVRDAPSEVCEGIFFPWIADVSTPRET